MSIDAVIKQVERNEKPAVERLIEWLRIPSISTNPDCAGHCREAAQWAAQRLQEAGLAAELHETGTKEKPGHPIVWATNWQTPGNPAQSSRDAAAHDRTPHILFYGHYDVQPPEPLELWESPPFKPVIRPAEAGPKNKVPGERIVARGAVDDKGQVACFLEALLAWKQAGPKDGLPIRLSVLLEGEEESGSINLDNYVHAHKDVLKTADICVISDTGMLGRGLPAITYGVRGLAYTECILHAANQDLHSGLWGGRCPNPIGELTKVLAQLWDGDRRVTIPGFYDKVRDIEAQEKANWSRLPIDSVEALATIGLTPEANVGEKGFNATEREWARPTAEINGIYGGYMAKGAKTVIPSHAGAKVSFRLVADQNPDEIASKFKAWLEARTPPGCHWEFVLHSGGWPGTVSTASPYLTAASKALERAGGVSPFLIKSGGSIPVVGLLKSELELDTILMGFGLEDDRVHSPNEKFELDCFRLGMKRHAILIDELSRVRG